MKLNAIYGSYGCHHPGGKCLAAIVFYVSVTINIVCGFFCFSTIFPRFLLSSCELLDFFRCRCCHSSSHRFPLLYMRRGETVPALCVYANGNVGIFNIFSNENIKNLMICAWFLHQERFDPHSVQVVWCLDGAESKRFLAFQLAVSAVPLPNHLLLCTYLFSFKIFLNAYFTWFFVKAKRTIRIPLRIGGHGKLCAGDSGIVQILG